MKIQNQSSVLSTGVWKINEMSQVQETQKALPVAQTESTATLLSEAQRNQRLSEFKTQEQLLRMNLQLQIPSNLNSDQILSGQKIDRQLDGSGDAHNLPEEHSSATEVANGRYADQDGNWNTEAIAHDITNIANTRRLIDDLYLDGRDAHGFDPQGTFDRGDIQRLNNYADWLAGMQMDIPPDVFIRAADLADLDNPDVMRYIYGENGLGGRLGSTPSSDFSSDPTNPRGEGTEQSDPVSGPREHPSVGPRHGRQHRPASRPNGGNSTNSGSGSAPRNQKSDSGPKNIDYSTSTNSSNDSHKSGTDNRNYNSGNPAPKKTDNGGNHGDYENDTHDENNDIDIVSPAGLAPGELPTLSNDPMTGHGGGSGNDIGASGRIPKGSPDNRSGIQQMVQPGVSLFSSTTGADDKDRPNTGNTSGTVWNPSEGDDLGDDLPYDLSGGGSVDIEAGKALLEQIRPINPGGPDPTNIKK